MLRWENYLACSDSPKKISNESALPRDFGKIIHEDRTIFSALLRAFNNFEKYTHCRLRFAT